MFRAIYRYAAKKNDLDLRFTSKKVARGYFILSDGSKHHFSSNNPGLNGSRAVSLAKDKYRCGEKLRANGICSPLTIMLPSFLPNGHEGESRDGVEFMVRQALHLFLDQSKFPVFVKPNTGSQGYGVYKADNQRSLSRILSLSRKKNQETLVQQACSGDEFRVVVLDGKIVMAYQKVPVQIVGDGKSTIHDLLVNRLDELRKYRKLKLSPSSRKIDFVLASMGYQRNHILEDGKVIQPVPNANLSQGGYPVDRPEYIREHFGDVCSKISKVLNLPWMGLDLMVEKDGKGYNIIEVNSKPGFGKYAGESKDHRQRVADVYSQCISYANTGRVELGR